MSGDVLYRKWRPPRFADVVGQEPITRTLTQAVAGDRTAHAYLLCGPRGTGKTSTARVLAKALNCTGRADGAGDPCGSCDACEAIERGNFLDLIEIDAASNRGIDEMRDLREKVRFSPLHARVKVYIIDEAHALTNDAFNAFLKTLEEPPPHTVFILATTAPHRLPATIVSRCQRFDFHRIASSAVVERLEHIARAEGVDVSPEVLRTVARAAGGSLRDATNLLDQLITSFGAHVSIEQVRELLGLGGEERALALVKHLLAGSTAPALEVINAAAAEGLDLRPLHQMTVDFLRAALLLKTGVRDALDLSKEALGDLSFAASSTSMEHILRALRLFGQVSLRLDQPSPLQLELATVELGIAPEPAPARQAAAIAQPRLSNRRLSRRPRNGNRRASRPSRAPARLRDAPSLRLYSRTPHPRTTPPRRSISGSRRCGPLSCGISPTFPGSASTWAPCSAARASTRLTATRWSSASRTSRTGSAYRTSWTTRAVSGRSSRCSSGSSGPASPCASSPTTASRPLAALEASRGTSCARRSIWALMWSPSLSPCVPGPCRTALPPARRRPNHSPLSRRPPCE